MMIIVVMVIATLAVTKVSMKRMKEKVKAPICTNICVPSNVGEFDEPFLRYILSDF